MSKVVGIVSDVAMSQVENDIENTFTHQIVNAVGQHVPKQIVQLVEEPLKLNLSNAITDAVTVSDCSFLVPKRLLKVSL